MAEEIAAAGAVVWRASAAGYVEIALVHRPRYDDWSLPKGKLAADEWTRTAAVREVREETGARVVLGRFLGRVRYRVNADPKVVDYFAARYVDGEFVPSEEVDEVRWLAVPAAAELLTQPHDRPIVTAFAVLPAALTTLLLVRHAKAGRRDQWSGVDELRPLSKNGLRQVEPVHRLAALYGADRVYSAPLVRCVQTVQPMADDLGVKVVEEELLSEKAYTGKAEAAVRRLLEIVADGGVPVVCSQGGVIPDLVSRLAGVAGLALRNVESKKGSVWALFFDDKRLAAADYVRPGR
ncbi:MAG: NUDIX hydrolase [Pseudonocardiaceae bacterium]|nr:NUDIX hydrolase [Pseudonocardiaceae bacterium]